MKQKIEQLEQISQLYKMKDECSEETLDSIRVEKTNFDEQFEFKPVNKKKHDKKK